VFLAEARRAGWDVQGIEVSEYAAERARARGVAVTTALAESVAAPAGTYDCVCLWDVLEHVRDPAAVVCQAGAALRPGGVLALSTGDLTSWCARWSGAGWHLFNLPEHLFFFSPASLRALLARAGCRVAEVAREVNWVPLGYIAERLRKAPSVLAALAHAARLAPAHWVVPATLGDVLGVYGVRGPA
jgi:SAM-dependent methyltransferase